MQVPTPPLDAQCPLDSHGLRTYFFNDYYLRYFCKQLAQAKPLASQN